MDKRRFILPWFLIVLIIICEVLKTSPASIEMYYSRGIYPSIIGFLNRISGLIPFSLFEAVLHSLLLTLFGGLIILGWRLFFKQQEECRRLTESLLSFLSVSLGFVILFNVLWGFNYHRLPLAEQMGIRMTMHSGSELSALCTDLITEANALSLTVERDAGGVMIPHAGANGVLNRTVAGFLSTNGSLPLFKDRFANPKPVWNSTAMSYAGIAGVYSPFTGEANVNMLLPAAMLPATAMHEMAHVYGYAREDEANFIAWLTCRFHPDPDFRYSGSLLGLIYGMDALYTVDPDEYQRLKKDYSDGVKSDLAANNDFWKLYEGPVERVHEKVNDRYLKANGQTDGVASYGRMVDLLLEVQSGKILKNLPLL